MAKKYIVRLSEEERDSLRQVIKKLKGSSHKVRRAQTWNNSHNAKKNGMSNRQIQYWVIPPTADGEFVAHMESVLDTYPQPY
jgi:hypothetical protein